MDVRADSTSFDSGGMIGKSVDTNGVSNSEMSEKVKAIGESDGEIAASTSDHGFFSRLFGMSTLSHIRTVKESLQQCRRDIRACTDRFLEGHGGG